MKTVQFFSALLLMGAIVSVSSCKPTTDSTSSLPAEVEDNFNFIVANDLGRNGYYDQKIIAEQMGDPELMLDWYPVLGNHEYRGNTQAVLDYSGVSRRWCMPARYYDKSFEVGDSSSLKVVFIDTAPLIDKYHKESEESYRDVAAQDMEAQLHWIDSVLNASHETWKIVIGHHPVYAQTPKDEIERENLQQRLDPLLRKYDVDMYIAGHIHNFQHIKVSGSDVDYVVNSSASLSRKVSEIEGTQYCSPEPGFSVVSVSDKDLNLYMLDKTGHVLHTVTRTR